MATLIDDSACPRILRRIDGRHIRISELFGVMGDQFLEVFPIDHNIRHFIAIVLGHIAIQGLDGQGFSPAQIVGDPHTLLPGYFFPEIRRAVPRSYAPLIGTDKDHRQDAGRIVGASHTASFPPIIL